MNISDVTMIIKTFERPKCVKRLVKSIYKFYPEAKILIGDDSESSCKQEIESLFKGRDIKVFDLPNDCGLSYGRNYLLENVTTEYFLLLDDDFVFDKKTKILEALETLIEHNFDILGGYCRNYKIINKWSDWLIVYGQHFFRYELPTNYIGSLEFDEKTRTLYSTYYINKFPQLERSDIVCNFFVAKTGKVREENLWDEELKLHEHTPFFLEAKRKGFKVAMTNQLSIRHMPIRMRKYNSFRDRDFVQIFMHKYNINKIIQSFDDRETKIIEKKERYD